MTGNLRVVNINTSPKINTTLFMKKERVKMISLFKRKRKINEDVLQQVRDMRCLVCNTTPCDPCHIRSRGAGGDDDLNNLMPLCRACHRLQHAVGLVRFARTHGAVKDALWAKGWEIAMDGDGNKRLRMI